MAVRTSILLTWRALLAATFLAVTAVLVVSGLTIVVLGSALARCDPARRFTRHRLGHLVRGTRPRCRHTDAQPTAPRRASAQDRCVLTCVLRRGAGGVCAGVGFCQSFCAAEREGGRAPVLSLSAPSFAHTDCRALSGADKFAGAHVPLPLPDHAQFRRAVAERSRSESTLSSAALAQTFPFPATRDPPERCTSDVPVLLRRRGLLRWAGFDAEGAARDCRAVSALDVGVVVADANFVHGERVGRDGEWRA